MTPLFSFYFLLFALGLVFTASLGWEIGGTVLGQDCAPPMAGWVNVSKSLQAAKSSIRIKCLRFSLGLYLSLSDKTDFPSGTGPASN
ncbi:hypothetical protein V1507DRAFT_463648 [Lipomyces tetrasporus]